MKTYTYFINCKNCNKETRIEIPFGKEALEYIRGNHDKNLGEIRDGILCKECGCLLYSGVAVTK